MAGLSVHRPQGVENLLTLLQTGNGNRTQHPTDANATSSRSHAVFTIHVHQQPRTASMTCVGQWGNGIFHFIDALRSTNVRMAKMTLIDLAGSERASASNNIGARMREGSNISQCWRKVIRKVPLDPTPPSLHQTAVCWPWATASTLLPVRGSCWWWRLFADLLFSTPPL